MTEVPQDAAFMADLVMAMNAQTQSVNWSLICSLTVSGRRDEARLALVRANVMEAYGNPWMPQPYLIMNAMWPHDREVEEWLVDHYGPTWREPDSAKLQCECCR